MNAKIFRLILTASGITDIAAIISAIFEHRMLPPELWAYVSSCKPPAFAIYVFCGWAVATILSYFGLYRWKSWARTLFLLLIIASDLLTFISPTPVVLSSLAYFFITTNVLLSGIIIACAYFNPAIKERFDRKDAQQPSAAGCPPQGVGPPDP